MDINPYRSPAAPLRPHDRPPLPRGSWLAVGCLSVWSFSSSVCLLMVCHLLFSHQPRDVAIVFASGLTSLLSLALYRLHPLKKPPPPHTPSRPGPADRRLTRPPDER